ncbi:hypothetical protein G4177_30700 [Corallococcus sp. ZKHCc1 1396]|uniref:Uncharacterized protein n=1 Tax=Corallococcus soli TaxID=2710757 RepID=A0ABR9PXR1_9BACT|nr:hypothetical protein [Corallococcus soli]MBE4752542.1 hypothetical protein [Corallococcus soli]
MDTEGALGRAAVGGITSVQVPDTALVSTMAAALAQGPVDTVLPREQMPAVMRAGGGRGAV